MDKSEIHLSDINRILFGEAPPAFLLEVFVRTAITYLLLLFIVRWLGKRMSGQLTIMEMAVMLTLGAIVAVPMQVPDRGILQGVLLLICTVWFQRGLTLISFRSDRFEHFAEGKPSMLVKNGILQLDQMEKERISHQQLFSELRRQKLFNLGMADRVYLEASGIFSVFTADNPKPGLAVLPPDDGEILKFQPVAHDQNANGYLACCNCGNITTKHAACENCGNNDWINAIN